MLNSADNYYFNEFDILDDTDKPLFITKNLSQSSNLINNYTFIRLFKFKKLLEENEPIVSPSIPITLFHFKDPIKYTIFLLPSYSSSLSIKIEFSTQIPNCFINIQLSIHSKLREMFTSAYEDKYSLGNPFFFKNDYISYDKQLLELKMLNPMIIRVRIFQYRTPKPCDGLLGIINEGNTCYMNSIIQNLANIPLIHNIIIGMPSKEDDHLFSLQKLIYNLKHHKNKDNDHRSGGGIKISDYLQNTSFLGNFAFKSQQDAQEIYLYLFEYLSNKEKEYCDAALFAKLCQGLIQSDIKCDAKEYSSSIKESFFFLSLNINNCTSLYSCIEKYLQVEKLVEDNQLEIDNEKYEAMKTISFKSLPKILMIHLKRFSINNKLTQEVIYPNELDLGVYFEDNGDYMLYSVIVHEGLLNNGHYYAYIKQFKENKWIKCNDSIVTYATDKEVFDDNYGGYTDWVEVSNDGEFFTYNKDIERTAYILTYIDKNYITEVFCDYSVSNAFVKQLYHLSKQKTILDYINQSRFNSEEKVPVQTKQQKQIENDPIVTQIKEERSKVKLKDKMTTVVIEVVDNGLKTKSNQEAYLDMENPIYSFVVIEALVSIYQNHSNCRLAKINSALNMFISFVNDNKEDLRPLLIKPKQSQTTLKLFIVEMISEVKNIYIIQKYTFTQPKIEIDHIIVNDTYFFNCLYNKNASNLFEVVSTIEEIEQAKKFEEIKLKPYQYNENTTKEVRVVPLIIKKMN